MPYVIKWPPKRTYALARAAGSKDGDLDGIR